MPTIAETEAHVRHIFDDVIDHGGKPYADHCFRVAAALPAWASEEERHASLLHDVVEDTALSASCLRHLGYSERTIELVEALTRRESETYTAYINRIAASGDRGLIAIKLADNADNLDPSRPLPLDKGSLRERYRRAREVLLASIR